MTDQIPSPSLPPESPTPSSPTPGTPTPRRNSGLVWGAILIAIGVFALLQQVAHFDLGLYFLPLLAVVFLLAGVLGRRYGLIIPGGILAGIGVGAIVVDQYMPYASDQTRGGVFMITFAAGWLLITLASLLIGRQILWPLIPGAFMGLFGIILLTGQNSFLSTVAWPVILIAIGLYLVLRRRELTKK